MSVDALGLQLDDAGALMTHPPSIMVYGPVGSGKSTELVKCFQNALFVTSSPTILRPYGSWVRLFKDGAAKGYKPVDQIAMKTIPEFGPDGVTPVSTISMLNAIIQRFCLTASQGTNPYSGIVFDEFSEFARRVWDEFERIGPNDPRFKSNKGKFDTFKAQRHFATWVSWVAKVLPQVTGRSVGFVCHEAETKYDHETGAFKYKGGPNMPFGTLREKVCADVDIVLRITLKTGGLGGLGADPKTNYVQRNYWTEAGPLWVAKFRDFAVDPEEPLDLPALLVKAEYFNRTQVGPATEPAQGLLKDTLQ